jgi:hypothetical protein
MFAKPLDDLMCRGQLGLIQPPIRSSPGKKGAFYIFRPILLMTDLPLAQFRALYIRSRRL